MSFLNKLRYYSGSRLFTIFIYKIGYKISLLIENIRQTILPSDIPAYVLSKDSVPEVQCDFDLFLKLVSPSLAEQGIEVLQNKISLFGTYYENKNWLDEVTGSKFWPSDTFFSKSKTKLNGYADVKFVLEKNKLNHLVTAAVSYYHTRNIEYIEFIDRNLISWIDAVDYERSVANRIIMDVAFRSLNLIQVAILCFDSPVFRERIYPKIHGLLVLYERQIWKFSTPRWFKTGNGANHVIGEMVGLIIIQNWLSYISSNGQHKYKKKLKVEYEWLSKMLTKLVTPRGVYLEHSANYSRLVCEFLIIFDIFEKALGNTRNRNFEDRFLNPLIQYVSDLSYKSHLPNFGDNDGATVLTAFKKHFYDISPIIDYKKEKLAEENLRRYLSDGQFLWKSKDQLDIFLFSRVGHFSAFRPGAATHNHCDLLAVLLYAKGIPLFIDKGCYYYNQSPAIVKDNRCSANHNTVSFKGKDQADIDASTYFNYPESCFEVNNESSIFSGFVEYKGVKHNRVINYQTCNSIIIEDSINVETPNAIAQLYFLLHEKLLAEQIDKKTVNLYHNDSLIAEIHFQNIQIELCEQSYYPHYANERKTLALIGTKEINGLDTITTTIKF